MAAKNVVVLNTATPRLEVAQVGDTYNFPVAAVFAAPTLFSAGAAATPSISFSGDPDTGFYTYAANSIGIAAAGAYVGYMNATEVAMGAAANTGFMLGNTTDGLVIGLTSGITFTSGTPASGTKDLVLRRDAANVLAQRNSTNAQAFKVYGNYASSTEYQRSGCVTTRTANAAVSGASITMSGVIPAGAFLIGVTTQIVTTLGTGSGTTGYTVGDGSDVDLWGALVATAAGASTASAQFTAAGACGFSTSARDVVLTATGGNFNGTGAITVCCHYLITEAD